MTNQNNTKNLDTTRVQKSSNGPRKSMKSISWIQTTTRNPRSHQCTKEFRTLFGAIQQNESEHKDNQPSQDATPKPADTRVVDRFVALKASWDDRSQYSSQTGNASSASTTFLNGDDLAKFLEDVTNNQNARRRQADNSCWDCTANSAFTSGFLNMFRTHEYNGLIQGTLDILKIYMYSKTTSWGRSLLVMIRYCGYKLMRQLQAKRANAESTSLLS